MDIDEIRGILVEIKEILLLAIILIVVMQSRFSYTTTKAAPKSGFCLLNLDKCPRGRDQTPRVY